MSPRTPPHKAWKQIAEDLRLTFENADMREGDALPTAQELAARYGVHRHTARQAYLYLQDLGLVRVEQGRGAFFQGAQLVYPIGRRVRFRENLRRQALDPASLLLSCDKAPAPARVARLLGQAPGAQVWRVVMLNMSSSTPISLGRHHVPLVRAPKLKHDLEEAGGSFTAAFAAGGIGDYERLSTRISARQASDEEAERLRMKAGAPVIVTLGVDGDRHGKPLQVTEAIFRADKTELLVENELAGAIRQA